MSNKMSTADRGIAVLNAVRDAATADYRAVVPEANLNNLAEIGAATLQYDPSYREYSQALLDVIVKQEIVERLYVNPLASFITGFEEFGEWSQQITVNPAIEQKYSAAESANANILKDFTPDIKSSYFHRNREGYFPVTIADQDIKKSFLSWGNFDSFIRGVINSLYSGDNISMFQYTKEALSSVYTAGNMVKVQVTSPTDETTGKAFMKTLLKTMKAMQYPTSDYNAYALMPGAVGDPLVTFTPPTDFRLIIRSDILVEIGVDVITAAFNISPLEINARIAEVDAFSDASVLAVLLDYRAYQIEDNLLRMNDYYNDITLKHTFVLHHWQTYKVSPLFNMVALTTNAGATAVTSVEVNPSVATVDAGNTLQLTALVKGTGNYNKNVTWKSSDNTNAPVSETGQVNVGENASGTVTITATSVGDNTKTATCTITVG